MSIIKVLELTDLLRIQMEKMFVRFGYDQVEFLEGLVNENVKYTFRNSDLIILDLDNYGVDVVSIIKELKSNDTTQAIPIILLSSQSDINTLKRAIQAGCTDFVTKPLTNEILMQKVHRLLKKSKIDLITPSDIHKDAYAKCMSLKWQKDYEIGIEEIDKDHKSIIESYEKLYSYMKTGLGHSYYDELVKLIEHYVNDHFALEEDLQKNTGFAARVKHKELHDEFKYKVRAIISTHKRSDTSNLDLIRLNLFLKDWILHHILVEDVKFGEFIKSQNYESQQDQI